MNAAGGTTPRRGRAHAAIAAIVLLVSCGTDGSDTAGRSADSAAATTQASADITVDVDAAIAASVDVRAAGCGPRVGFGTGSVIDGGYIVTVAHVVAGADDISVIDADGTTSDATVVSFDPDLDFAILRPAQAVGTPLALRSTDAVPGETGIVVLPRLIDDDVMTEIADIAVVRTVNIDTTDIYLDRDVQRAGFEVEASIDPGDSGAMVVVPGGGVGVIWARSSQRENRAWAIDLPAEVIDGSAVEDAAPVDVGPCRDVLNQVEP